MKKYDVYLMPDAIKDLEDVYTYIADKSGFPERAWAYIEKLRNQCDELAIAPIRGHKRDDLMKDLRIVPIDKKALAAIVMDGANQTVLILNIFYGGRDYESLMSKRDS
ncbi:type II toxin-antitoxin system RelE/ParE family toxin [Desulfobulbus rhabdoformis]|uniref:type II toxin-antitoxin system RelE/ParE family toxin n=1 Tax=Desulfobulbus rhabdoformis TaxID=34032 RepID=UPI001963FB3B|nr:type II toxin-antitoxin system RelE/ParE family toxin [Desulfobulbus rhabdoformis]MBM9616081.1 type II toxin-antitoxin system RelE/ParE family toxin [Desulfobulbus rhabdoformis]